MTEQPEAGWRKFVMEASATGGLPAAPTSVVTAPTPFSAGFPSPPSFDPIERLPEERKNLFRKVCQHADDACALAVPFEDVRLASMYRVEKENELRRLTSHPQDDGFNLPETDRRVILAQQALTKATDDLRRVQARQDERAAAQQAALRVKANCEQFLRYELPGDCRLEAIEVEPPKLLKGEASLLDAVENRRRRCRELKADLHRVASAPFPSSHAKAKMRAQIEALAMQGAPSVALLIEHDGKVEFQTQSIRSEVHGTERALAFAEAPDAIALTCWLHRDLLIKRLDEEISSESDDRAALSHTDRELRSAEIQGDLLDIERQEASLTWSAMEQNFPIEFRSDISPLALLGLKLITTPRAEAPPETSPGLSWPWK